MWSLERNVFPLLGFLGTICASQHMARAGEETGPPESSNLVLKAPIDRWDEAIPLGNGLGGLLWGSGRNIKLSLDRGDLWDLRTPETLQREDWTYETIQKLVREKNQAQLVKLFDQPYNAVPYPTKIPAGRLEIELDASQEAKTFRLNLKDAAGEVDLGTGTMEVHYNARVHLAMIRIPGPEPKWNIVPPASLQRLGYDPPKTGREGEIAWSLQEAALGLKYAVVAGSRRKGNVTEIALTISASRDGQDPVSRGKEDVNRALDSGYDRMRKRHVEWWSRFWAQSRVRLPDPAIQQHYDLVQYFYGAASRRGAPPIPLQGVWTADAGGLPPWHGDYHHDLNTQMTYWAYLSAGHFEEGMSFIEFLWDLLPENRKFARKFYNAPGAAVPGVMTLDGKPMGGWGQYSLSPTNGAWVAQSFYLHWRYTMDPEFLAQRAYPYCAAIAECLESLLKPGPGGKLKLPLSTSPEIHNNSLRAWLTPNSNYDLSLLRWLFGALVEMADARGNSSDATRWKNLLEQLEPLAVEGEDGPLRISPDESLQESHRHHSHTMAIHPLGTLHVEGTDRDRKIIEATLEQMDRLGTRAWCGYSFSWRACIAARCGDPEGAMKSLEIFLKAFISRNGFHLNGDYKRLGYSDFAYRPFTLEGNFAAAQAVHEMLLQSWGGVVRIFPAVPEAWGDVSFHNLRAEGGFEVSAVRRGGRTVQVRIGAPRGGFLRLRDPFDGKAVSWNRDVRKEGRNFECKLRPGEVLEGR